MCRKSFEEDEATDEEIDAELAIIRAQIGFCYQMLRKEETSLRMYNQILRQKYDFPRFHRLSLMSELFPNRPEDSSVVAVVSNNIVTINREQNVFDSKKKMKTALSEALDSRLSQLHRQSIVFNNCLLLLHTNQIDSFRKQLEQIKAKYPQMSCEALLLEASFLCKEKKVSEAIELLKNWEQKHNKSPAIEVALTLTQLLIREGRTGEACKVLRSLGSHSYKPAIVSTLVTLYLSLDDKESATALLTEAVEWYEKNKVCIGPYIV